MNLHMKAQLTPKQLALLESEMQNRRKSTGVAYALWFFLTIFAAQKFYLRNYVWGVIYFVTLSLFGLGVLWDLFTLPSQTQAANDKIEREILNEIMATGAGGDSSAHG